MLPKQVVLISEVTQKGGDSFESNFKFCCLLLDSHGTWSEETKVTNDIHKNNKIVKG